MQLAYIFVGVDFRVGLRQVVDSMYNTMTTTNQRGAYGDDHGTVSFTNYLKLIVTVIAHMYTVFL